MTSKCTESPLTYPATVTVPAQHASPLQVPVPVTTVSLVERVQCSELPGTWSSSVHEPLRSLTMTPVERSEPQPPTAKAVKTSAPQNRLNVSMAAQPSYEKEPSPGVSRPVT